MMPRRVGGRPKGTLGPIAKAILDTLGDQAMTATALARRLQLTTMAARYTCSRLEASGLLTVVRRVRVAGAHKPVACYARAMPQEVAPAIQLANIFFRGSV